MTLKQIIIEFEDNDNLPFTASDLVRIKRFINKAIEDYYDIKLTEISIRNIEIKS